MEVVDRIVVGGRAGVRTGLGVHDDVEVAVHAGLVVAGDLAEHRIDADAELAELEILALTRLQVLGLRAEQGDVVHLGVGVGDTDDHLARGRHDVLRRELEGTELHLDDRDRATSPVGAGRLLARGADAAQREEAEDQRGDGERHREPAEERTII